MKRKNNKQKRVIRTRKRITSRGRKLVVYRSNKYILAQLVDITTGKTFISETSKKMVKSKVKMTKTEKAFEVGKKLAKRAVEMGVKRVVFDKGGYRFHGRVKAVAEGARKGGLQF
jgi:large subunit ribosomal protein L18